MKFFQGGTDMLSPKTAQSIVDRTMSILGVHVNIMDAMATVIAAGNPKRVGQFHAGAAKVLKTGKKLSISCVEAKRMDGVKPGITLPITFKGKIIGAVGMTGDPKDVESFGELLKLTAELMVEQAAVKEEIYLEQRARESLLSDLLTGHWQEYERYFLRRAELLDYDLKKKHLIIAAEMEMESADPGWLSSDQGLLIQKLRARMEKKFSSSPVLEGRLVSCFINGKLAIMYQLLDNESLDDLASQKKIAESIHRVMCSGENLSVTMGVGGIAEDWKQIHRLYEHAKNALWMDKIYQKYHSIVFFSDFTTEYMLTFLPAHVRKEYYERILGPLLQSKDKPGAQWNKTMQTYFDNDMNSLQTAKALFLHRNTLIFRLNKIKEATGFHPQKFQDAVHLKLALMLLKMEEEIQKEGSENQEPDEAE